ncbi:MAG: hypothetical protein AB9844_08440 [Clostridiaceae bacterium]
MKSHIKSSLSRIKAEDELIQKTENLLKYNYEKQNSERTIFARMGKIFSMRRPVLAAFAAVMTVCVLSAGGFSYYKTPVAYVSLDINPSVELSVNKFNKIVSATAYNEDGKVILEDKTMFNSSVKDAISELVKAASEKGYIKNDGSTIILVTSETEDSVVALSLGKEAEEGAKDAIKSSGDVAVVYKDTVNLDKRDEAQKLGVSPGKLNLIEKLQALDPTVTVDQYRSAEVTAIMQKIVAVNSTGSNQNPIPDMQNIANAVQQSGTNAGSSTGTAVKPAIKVVGVTTSAIRKDTVMVKFSDNVGNSALDTNNYKVEGANIFSKAIFTNSEKDAVKLTVEPGTIKYNGPYVIKITNIEDVAEYSSENLTLYETVKPKVTAAFIKDLITIKVVFSEKVSGDIDKSDFKVYTKDGETHRIDDVSPVNLDENGAKAWVLTIDGIDDPESIIYAGTSSEFDGTDANGNIGETESSIEAEWDLD